MLHSCWEMANGWTSELCRIGSAVDSTRIWHTHHDPRDSHSVPSYPASTLKNQTAAVLLPAQRHLPCDPATSSPTYHLPPPSSDSARPSPYTGCRVPASLHTLHPHQRTAGKGCTSYCFCSTSNDKESCDCDKMSGRKVWGKGKYQEHVSSVTDCYDTRGIEV